MCGRFVQARDPEEYAEWFGVDRVVSEPLPPRWNVAPGLPVYAVADHEEERLLGTFRWGFVPRWAKDPMAVRRAVNARVETVASSPMFRDAFRRRRCIVPADGFYEWEARPDRRGKIPHYLYDPEGRPLALAGVWDAWHDPDTDEVLRTCVILTRPADDLVARIHDRMPVVLPPRTWDAWLDPHRDAAAAKRVLIRLPTRAGLAEHPVSTMVNKVANDSADLIRPLPEDPEPGAVSDR